MRKDVPFRIQDSKYECGPSSLQIAMAYLGDEKGREEIKKALDYEEGKAVYTIQLATAAEDLGFQAEFFTADPWNEHEGEEFTEEFTPDIENQELYEEAEEAGVEVSFQELELDEVLELLTDNSIPIVLIGWNVIKGEEKYQGHFVPVVGYTEDKILVHEPSTEDGAYTEIEREKFDEARRSEGTDQDVAIIKSNI